MKDKNIRAVILSFMDYCKIYHGSQMFDVNDHRATREITHINQRRLEELIDSFIRINHE